ncbi:hypothetical protein V495_06612 [Pseudogymnoascus sp. VKM F-4514 (FW-929)]|nr:hypothetical protein V495_06612 [Pseudogymnoascus sp. VKM F-4514 (FW-929)]
MIAVGQRSSARRSLKKFRNAGFDRWTLAHAFLADMGGFVLEAEDLEKPIPVDAEQLFYLIERKHVDYPSLSKEEIDDKSKTDTVARFLTIAQAVWFVAAFISRPVQGLSVTTLELTTISFIIVFFATSYCWMHKPAQVSRPVILHCETSIAQIRIQAGHHDPNAYQRTPLDFVDPSPYVIGLLWRYYVYLLHKLGLPLMSRPIRDRPQTRIRGDNFLRTELDHELFAAVFIAAFSSAFMGAWNFHFPTTAERNLWRCASVYTLGFGALGSIYVWIWHRWLPPRQQQVEELEMGQRSGVRNAKLTLTKRIGAVSPDDPPDSPIPLSLLGPCTFLYEHPPQNVTFQVNSPASMQQIYSPGSTYPSAAEDPLWEYSSPSGVTGPHPNSQLSPSAPSASVNIPVLRSESEDMFLDSSFPSIDFSLAGDFHPQFGMDELSYLGMDFTSTFNPSAVDWNVTCEQGPPSMSNMASPQNPLVQPLAMEPPPAGDQTPSQKPADETLTVHLLSQHFSRQLTGRFSFKSADWTFYNFFFHRFTTSHPWVLSAILSWTSASLFYSGRWKDLNIATFHYEQCLSQLTKISGRSFDDVEFTWPSAYDPVKDRHFSAASIEDIDALFVSCFFLALFDQMAARPSHIRKIFRFISHVLQVPNVRDNMGGVRSRVSTWFCTLESKASAFQPGDGAILSALGGQEGLVSALRASHDTLQKVYSVTYPDEERRADELQLPLLQRMLNLTVLLSDITQEKSRPSSDGAGISIIRAKLDAHAEALDAVAKSENLAGRVRSTWLVLLALYNTAEISFSRNLNASEPRHSADAFAVRIIQVAQKLDVLRGKASLSTPPPTKIWPLPLVMAAIEVQDPIYREWVLHKLETYGGTAGQQYTLAKVFVEKLWEREEEAGRRVDCAGVIAEINDGMVF